ncbi:hypothetical protein SAMN05216420_10923 [Nitrosospira sp. Nl5]|uniref:hypothetical protein n=1 Tax=Nitrosospira sp. Nl5 TaxID=200120 RepID=UPI000881F0D0|nr:hypothetical protein [Nitrosospira sp. Nl5]SCY57294.1 hypothetical protein SAMN05216420_10923 [Nitrosospira sp. Nl5]
MKALFAALTACALTSQAIAYDRNRSIGEEWQQQRGTAETQRIEEAARQRESEHNARMQQLDRQQKIQQQENEWRQRQLELEQNRLWLWSR